MQGFLQTLVLGVSAGSLDAVLAMAIVVIYRTTGVLNFALGATGSLAAYVAFAVSQRGAPLALALSVGAAVGGLTGLTTFGAIAGLRSRQYALTAAVGTLAIAVFIQQIISVFWGSTIALLPSPFPLSGVQFGQITVQFSQIGAVSAAAVVAILVASGLRWTLTGSMLRAIADDARSARLCGANVPMLVGLVWFLGGALAAVDGFFVAPLGLVPSLLDSYFLAALMAAVLGGLRSLPLAVAGALCLEVARAFFQAYAPGNVTPYAQAFLLGLLVVALTFMPRRWAAPVSRAT